LLDCNLPCIYRKLLLIFITAITAEGAFGQVAAWPLDESAFQASPAAILSAAQKIIPEKYAQATVLYKEEKNTLESDGKVTNVHRLQRFRNQVGDYPQTPVKGLRWQDNGPRWRFAMIVSG